MNRIFFLFCLLIYSLTISAQTQKYSKIKIYLNGKDIQEVVKLGISCDNGVLKKGKYFIGEISENEILLLKKNGFTYDVLIDNMTKYYQDRNKNSKTDKKKKSSLLYPLPVHFKHGSMGGYFTYTEILQELDSLRILFPNLVSIKQSIGVGTTTEGRTIFYVKISNHPDIDENKPEVLYTALHHAREPAGMQQMFYYMYYLLENYNSDPEIKYLVDNLEMYFILCVNPDGYVYNQTNNPNGGGMHRKNKRNTGGSNPGVDLNRNYGMFFGYDNQGSSIDITNDAYRGPSGFSEPETQLMKSFTELRQFKLAINYHCYSNLLIYPWGYKAYHETPDSVLYAKYSVLMTASNNYAWGTPMQTVGYTANGSSDDWMYGEQATKNKIIAFSPEAGNADDGFWPEINRIDDVCRANMDMNFYIARFALKYAQISDLSPAFIGSFNSTLKFNLKCLGLDVPADFNVSISPLSPEIINMGSGKNFYGMSTLQEAVDSISFSLSPTTIPGQSLKFLVIVDNGQYSYQDTITKIFGQTQIAFTDPGNTITNWTASGGWNVTNAISHSPSKCITDSPNTDYSYLGVNSSITTTNAIALTNIAAAYLSFWTKWDIHEDQDYVQIKISTNNGTTWIPLTGIYTNSGVGATQLSGQPLYDGFVGDWVQEQINISQYIGQSVKFRFTLKSVTNFTMSYDGFYFDDFTVTTVLNTISNAGELNKINEVVKINPNPASSFTRFELNIPENEKSHALKIYNIAGQEIFSESIDSNNRVYLLNTSEFNNGVYFYQISSGSKTSLPGKLVVLH